MRQDARRSGAGESRDGCFSVVQTTAGARPLRGVPTMVKIEEVQDESEKLRQQGQNAEFDEDQDWEEDSESDVRRLWVVERGN